MSQQIRVKQVRSLNGHPEKLRRVVIALGLKGINTEKLHKDNNCIRGMVNKVSHLISYEIVK